MGKFSRDKGARGERELAMYCREQGYPNVKRTAQHKGNTGEAGDLEGLPGIHIECKRVEKFHLRESLAQSVHDAAAKKTGDIPVVFQRGSNQKWVVVMLADDWFKMYREYRS